MAEIRPFRGVHYSSSLIKDWSAVICPPHDIISPYDQQELYHSSEYNFVRLEYGLQMPQDTATDNRYTRSAATLEQWLKQGVLETDPAPAIYLHSHQFTLEGRQYKRRNIIARVRVEEWDKMIVRPHERTFTVTRSDRLSLLQALQANTSPILAMFEDRQRRISPLLADQERNKPMISSRRVGGESHDVWAITDIEVIKEISSNLAEQPLYIADGHHRYESALAYGRDRKKAAASPSPDAGYNFVMMELVDFADPGLVILAPHRLVKGISKLTLDKFTDRLAEFFEMERIPLITTDFRKQVGDFFTGADGIRVVIFGPATDFLLKLKLRDQAAASRMMPQFHSELYKKLDVSIVDHVILEQLLGMTGDAGKTGLAYNHDLLDTVNRVKNGEYQLAILLSPVKPETIKEIADAGDRMPPKSTYFYPKAPSGLVFNRLVD